MSFVRYLCLSEYSGVQHIVCCIFVLYVFVLCPMLPISLDCPFLIALSVFSNIYSVKASFWSSHVMIMGQCNMISMLYYCSQISIYAICNLNIYF